MSAGYVVRWASGAKLCVDTLGEAQQLLREAGEGAYVLRLDDGREERLPSYEEALGEIERLRAIHVTDRAEMAGAMAEMKECERALDEAIKSHARKDAEIERLRAIEALNVGAIDASLVRLGAVTGAIGPMPADPLAALEAAERWLLEAGGWVEVEPDVYGTERWDDPNRAGGRSECRQVALTIERRRLAAKCAQARVDHALRPAAPGVADYPEVSKADAALARLAAKGGA